MSNPQPGSAAPADPPGALIDSELQLACAALQRLQACLRDLAAAPPQRLAPALRQRLDPQLRYTAHALARCRDRLAAAGGCASHPPGGRA